MRSHKLSCHILTSQQKVLLILPKFYQYFPFICANSAQICLNSAQICPNYSGKVGGGTVPPHTPTKAGIPLNMLINGQNTWRFLNLHVLCPLIKSKLKDKYSVYNYCLVAIRPKKKKCYVALSEFVFNGLKKHLHDLYAFWLHSARVFPI